MKEKLESQIYNDFPKIFAQRHLSAYETCMCWGFECGDGWYEIIRNLCLQIQEYCDSNQEVPQVEVTQVKEKFGSLRFYVNWGNDKIYSFISKAEGLSGVTCELCGSQKDDVKMRSKGWITVRCDKCYDSQGGQ